MNKDTISAILPAFNEEENVAKAVNDIQAVLSSVAMEYEIIIVNDGSTDGTKEIINKMAASNSHLKTIHHLTNRGYAAALRSGFSAAEKELIFFTDSDNQFVVDDLKKLLTCIKGSDMVISYRIKRKDNFFRIVVSKLFNFISKLLFNLTAKDINCAFKLFRREVFEIIQIECDGFMFNMEILTKARSHKMVIKEVGVEHRPRIKGKSTMHLKHVKETIKGMIQLWRLLKRTKINGLEDAGNKA